MADLTRRDFLGLATAGAAGVTAAGLLGTLPACARDGLRREPAEPAPKGPPGPAAERPPNFVFIFADDLGYGDLSCFGSKTIQTPNLDRMAEQGTRFTDFYVAAAVCTPSRAALLTGCYPRRVGLPSVLFPGSKVGLNEKETTVAEILKARGYATACIGKWHLGHHLPFLPTRHGFDSYFGIPYSNDMAPRALLRNEEVIEPQVALDNLTERYTDEAVRFIKAQKEKPFFLYLPHTMPHVPLAVSEKFKGKSRGGLYGDVVECMDWSTGRILETLKELGLDARTLVIFTSDNGPWLSKGQHGGAAGPLRAGKGTIYEGGMREPAIARWPGRVPAGKTCSEMATALDILPTFAALAGSEVPKDRILDGKDIRPLLFGQADARTPHQAFFYNLGAVRRGKWKLHQNPQNPEQAELYDLATDIGEQKEVAAANPDVVKELTAKLVAFREDLAKNSRPPGQVEGDDTLPKNWPARANRNRN